MEAYVIPQGAKKRCLEKCHKIITFNSLKSLLMNGSYKTVFVNEPWKCEEPFLTVKELLHNAVVLCKIKAFPKSHKWSAKPGPDFQFLVRLQYMVLSCANFGKHSALVPIKKVMAT